MYFYIDESGHTGANLFDEAQPVLYYGALSSKINVDVVCERQISQLRKHFKVARLHANELGMTRIAESASTLERLVKNYDIRFDFYRIKKADHALICFFDQVFDAAMNPAITWTGYWTPLRYLLLVKLSSLFDEVILRRAWAARINFQSSSADTELAYICETLAGRVHLLPDARSQELIGDALRWAAQNPSEIQYNVKNKEQLYWITPNLIGFQQVMFGIAGRLLRDKARNPKITVDQQSQFNKTQRSLADFYARAREIRFRNGPGLPELDFRGMPSTPIVFSSSADSAGLELVDIFLWLFKQAHSEKSLAFELQPVMRQLIKRGKTDEVSIQAIMKRWEPILLNMPEPTSPEQELKARELMRMEEERRMQAVRSLK